MVTPVTHSARVRHALTSLPFALVVAACGDDTSAPADTARPDDDKRAQVAATVATVSGRWVAEFSTVAADLEMATSAWAADGGEAERAQAQAAWRAAMAAWQQLELTQLGPIGRMGEVVGGESIRDEIYSWPTTNLCRIDQELASGAYANVEAFATELINVRGLDALEYLLFRTDAGNACAAGVGINADGSWDAIVGDVDARRADYAATLATLVRQQATRLDQAWSGAGGFGVQLGSAGDTSTLFSTPQQALNSISDALYYLEKETKDMKLAEPAGLMNCAEATCPDSLESRWSLSSRENAAANIDAFLELWTGGDGAYSFDDLMVDIGAGAVGADFVAKLEAARAALDAIEMPLETALESDHASVLAAHDSLRIALELFKTQVISLLDLEPPQRAEGDND
jgi:predicted lipoprotein